MRRVEKNIIMSVLMITCIWLVSYVPDGDVGSESEVASAFERDAKEVENVGTRAVDVAVTDVAWDGGVDGWNLQDESRSGNYSIGIVGKTTRFTATVANNDAQAVTNVAVYCEIWTANTTADLTIQEIYNTTITVAQIAGNGAVNVQFTHRFLFSFLYNISASVNVTGDSDRSNDRFSLSGWANKWADDGESGTGVWTTMARFGGNDDWHRVDDSIDQAGHHTQDWSWYHGRDNGQYVNNMDVELISPVLDLSNMRTSHNYFEYPMTYAFKMVGDRADTGDKFYIDDLTSDNFVNVRNVFSSPGEVGIFDTWSYMRWYSDLNGNGQEDPGEPLGLGVPITNFWGNSLRTIQFRFRFTSDEAGVSHGYYIDDVIVFGLERYVEDTTPLPQITDVTVWDRPYDGGGHVYVNWNKCNMWDFKRYDLYGSQWPITDVSGLTPIISNITDAGNTTHLINELDGTPLDDGVDYYFAVSVTDIWDNVDNSVNQGSGMSLDNPPLGVTGLTGRDVPRDEGGRVEISWNPNQSPDFAYFNVYRSESRITSVAGLEPSVTNVNATSMIFENLTAENGYFFTVTSVDDSTPGNENGTITGGNTIGPVFQQDNLPPGPVTNIVVIDTPNDNGGSLEVSWVPCGSPDFDHYKVYVKDQRITNVSTVPVAKNGLMVNHTVIEKMNGNKLEDDVDYYIAVVAVDTSGNYLKDVTSSSPVTSFENIPPGPITILSVQDTPEDIGGTITVRWLSALDSDFDHYRIYIANHTFNSVENMTPSMTENNITTQTADITRIDNKPLVNLYEEYWIALTAVDARGNTNPVVECEGPVKCWENIPPEPVYTTDVYDTPGDDGGSFILEFEKSEEDDIDVYEVYVRRTEFFDIRGRTPEVTVPADDVVNDTYTVEVVTMDGKPLEDGREYYAAVSAVDISGNQYTGVIPSQSVIPLENLPPAGVRDLRAYDRPDDEGGAIVVEWNASLDPDFGYYELYVFDRNVKQIQPMHTPFTAYPEQDPGTRIMLKSETCFEVDRYQGKSMKTGGRYWVAVVIYDLRSNVNLSINCFGPVTPLLNIFPSLIIPYDIPEDIVVNVSVSYQIEVDVDDPLGDNYVIKWYRIINGKELLDRRMKSIRYIVPTDKAGNFKVTVKLFSEDDVEFDNHTWNVTVRKVGGESEDIMGGTDVIIYVVVIMVVSLMVILLVIILKSRRKKDGSEDDDDIAVPRHIIPGSPPGYLPSAMGSPGGPPGPPAAPGPEPVVTEESLAPAAGSEDAGTPAEGMSPKKKIVKRTVRKKKVKAIPGGRDDEVKALPPAATDTIAVEDDGAEGDEAGTEEKDSGDMTSVRAEEAEEGKEPEPGTAGDEAVESGDIGGEAGEEAREEAGEGAAEIPPGGVPAEGELEIDAMGEAGAVTAEVPEQAAETVGPGVTVEDGAEPETEEDPAGFAPAGDESLDDLLRDVEGVEAAMEAPGKPDVEDEPMAESPAPAVEDQGAAAEPMVEQFPQADIADIQQQYEAILREAAAVRKRLTAARDPAEQQSLLVKYQDLEKQVASLQQQANAIQGEQVQPTAEQPPAPTETPVAPEPVTVQCYSCNMYLTVQDPQRPVRIICPTCGAESILE